MQPQISPKLDPSNVAVRLGMCAAALAGVAAAPAAHAVVVNFTTPITIPETLAGVYINLLSGATGGSGGAVAGWDMNPYLAGGGTQLGIYWNPDDTPRGGAVVASGVGPALAMAPGSTVSSANVFSSAIIGTTTGSPFLTTGTNFLGFRFWNETTSATNYGYMSITTTGTSGFPATINGWSIETGGGPITVVPEPSTGILLSMGALALGAINMRRLRRERKQAAH